MQGLRIPRVPDDWTVWAFSDSHGVVSGTVTALQQAGLVDSEARWIAPPRTALVGCGDYLDRGRDVKGMVALLRRLEREAGEAGGLALFARGNHEQMVLLMREGMREWMETWLRYGGQATLESYGLAAAADIDVPTALDAMEAGSPGLFEWLDGLPQAVRWRDVIFVHGGLAPDHGPEDLGITTDEHLWIRAAFFETPWEAGEFDRYRHAGIERVVFGHTPQPGGPRLFHGGRSLCIDTNAVGNPHLPPGSQRLFTLLRLSQAEALTDTYRLTVSTDAAPDRAPI